MDSYKGYQLEINGIKLPIPDDIPFNIVEPGSYSFTKERRIINDWQDANGTFHHEQYPNDRAIISFQIKERTQEQHALLLPLFERYENIEVEYWDDNVMEYKTGLFYMDNVEAISSIATLDNIYYAAIDITLTEY